MTSEAEIPGLLERLRSRVDPVRYRLVYSNRDLDMARVPWIGFDMDYTLAIYHREALDELTHGLTLKRLIERGYPAALTDIPFDANFAIRGLVIDKDTGHILKLNSHRHAMRGWHGLRPLTAEELAVYHRDPPNLSDNKRRFALVDTLFELPETYIYAAVVDVMETQGLALNYEALATDVRNVVDGLHADGSLKDVVIADIPRFIQRDPDLAPALHRFRSAGKKLFLMTNSYADYTEHIMKFLLDGVHPDYPGWKQFFDVIITGASKPSFFRSQSPFLRLNERGMVVGEERDRLERGVVYQHGNLKDFSRMLGLGGDQILYVGDHIYGDILRSKRDSNWRTAMIIPEMEDELACAWRHRDLFTSWSQLERRLQKMWSDVSFEQDLLQRLASGVSDPGFDLTPEERAELEDTMRHLARQADRLRKERRDLAQESMRMANHIEDQFHPRWGALLKHGNEHSIFGEQVETYACVYTSRVSNFLNYSPAHYFRSPPDLLPHEVALRA